MTSRALSTAESELIRWLLADHMPLGVKPVETDLSTALVDRYDESECLRFVRPAPSDEVGFNSDMYTFNDRDGVPITAFLIFDRRGDVQEIDLWKVDDSPVAVLSDSVS